MSATTPIEKYLPPKHLSAMLCEDYGLCYSEKYIRCIRAESIRRGERVFVGGSARPTELINWIADNPKFRRRK